MHPNAIIAIAASANCEKLTQEIFGGEMAYVPWMRPGFELGLAMQEICRKKIPKAKAIMMGQHGFISWDERSTKECYLRTLGFHRARVAVHREKIRGQRRRREGVRRRKISNPRAGKTP